MNQQVDVKATVCLGKASHQWVTLYTSALGQHSNGHDSSVPSVAEKVSHSHSHSVPSTMLLAAMAVPASQANFGCTTDIRAARPHYDNGTAIHGLHDMPHTTTNHALVIGH
jgi:hypothetical protein